MGKVVVKNQPCLNDTCGSSDARQVYDDGTSYCFSCSSFFPKQEKEESFRPMAKMLNWEGETLEEVAEYANAGFRDRGITKKITQHFNVKVTLNDKGEVDTHYYPYGVTDIVGYKKRTLPKEFLTIGKLKGLFGQMQAGNGGKVLVITEGEIDAMTVAQAWYEKYDKIYPVVSIPSASQTKVLLENRDWIRNFDSVVIWFDNDDPGKEAADKAAKIIGFDKVKVVKNTKYKDANELYLKDKYQAVLQTVWDAQPWSPVGIVNSADTWELYKTESETEYIPWPPFAVELNKQIYGRALGSITLLTSGTGMGKSSFIKEDQYHLLQTTNEKIGICSLEESVAETVEALMALHVNKRIQLPDVDFSEEEEKKAWTETMGTGRFLFLDHQGSMGDDSLIDKMEFMALSGCKFLYLDHITIAVSDTEEMDVNRATDKMMSDLLKLAKRHNVWIGVISHLRKTNNNQKSFEEGAVPSDDDLKGSGSLKQIAAQIIAISRNKKEEDQVKRHTSRLWSLKDRWTGRTGPMGQYRFLESTGRLSNTEPFEEFDL
jgi:twinkle protein